MTQYRLNPHRHVKIWLSRNRSIFLNMANQLRLIRMRVINPQDEIHLVYDSRLLNEEAKLQLHAFCQRHRIIPINVLDEVVPNCRTPNELKLLAAYHEEIENVGVKGGNLASASDKLRVLSPIYCLGVYTDFDVDVNTRGLPETIIVKAPILISVGSFFVDPGKTVERISVNNEFFAVVDEHDARKALNRIQEIGLQLFAVQKEGAKNPYKEAPALIANILTKLSYHQNAREIRQSIFRLTQSNEIYARLLRFPEHLKVDGQRISFKSGTPKPSSSDLSQLGVDYEFYYRLQSLTAPENRKKILHEFRDRLSAEHALDFNREDFLDDCIQWTVIETTGPMSYCYGLFGKNQFSSREMEQFVNPFAMGTYQLSTHFKSNNGYPIHSDRATKEACIGRANPDSSWRLFGIKRIDAQQKVMENAALIIQKGLGLK